MNKPIYKVNAPIISEKDTSKIYKIITDPEAVRAMSKANDDYLHWDELKHKNWISGQDLASKELFWFALQTKRWLESSITPIRDESGKYFRMNTKNYLEFLHTIDKEMAGNLMGISNISESSKKEFIARNIIEESIASSQLEGANTSRIVAKKMLLEGRRPRNHSEIMIVNNHAAMLKIEQKLHKENLSWELICELHSIITDRTIPKDKQGKLRETFDDNGEKLKVIPWADGTIAYITPDKEFVEQELPRLINFANDVKISDSSANDFIHPLIKAIMLHFWIGLLHPFEDGNGRLARILFYWYMLKHEYWAFKYISLSEKIKKSSKQYAMAYIYSEQDNYDINYFVHYNIEKLKLARVDFQQYIKRVREKNRSIVAKNQEKYSFNDRQTKLLHYFYQEMESRTNLTAYQQLYSVKKGAAIADLKELTENGFLIKKRNGRNTYYYPTKAINDFFDS